MAEDIRGTLILVFDSCLERRMKTGSHACLWGASSLTEAQKPTYQSDAVPQDVLKEITQRQRVSK
jgi:hypothetical protein